ncbi:protein jag [Phycicoccus duodecadis]|uniref:SpoIIIJ-associated protein n=1 Tax=Phycicoccus duodecadis TaxID=173053 RepID=A0A2N3YM63_9MICO|nr:R3H domain-containing nucleic acid-binding protein [Phycicoccus duodecadis]PKW27955.1 spoIIIJ-associated protein [Phycicoccus duodecadis]
MSEQRTEDSEHVTDEAAAVSDTPETVVSSDVDTTEPATDVADESLIERDEDENEGADSDSDSDERAGDEGATGSRRGGRRAQLVREGEVAADFLETLLDICDLDGDLDVDVDGDRAAVSIVDSEDGRVPRRLVGPDGQVLDALQELTRLAVQSETGERSRLMLDVAGHRAERRAALVTIAKEAIAKVKDSGESTSLSPMSAFERKVVHDEVLAAGLVSESEGSEPRRYVVIAPTA